MKLALRGERIPVTRVASAQCCTGRVGAVDLRAGDVTGVALVRAIRGETVAGIELSCPTPGRIHEHVGHVHPSRSVHLSSALAAAARSLGHVAPQDDRLAAVRSRLSDLPLPAVDLADAKKRVADAGTEETRLREEIAAARGRVEALREAQADDEALAAAKATLRAAIERLSEIETDRIAAEQRLDHARVCAHEARTARQSRLELQDEAGNLERAVRESLVERVSEVFRAASHEVDGTSGSDRDPNLVSEPLSADSGPDPVTALLAIARLSAVRAPIVLEDVDRFCDPETAAKRLGAPVIQI